MLPLGMNKEISFHNVATHRTPHLAKFIIGEPFPGKGFDGSDWDQCLLAATETGKLPTCDIMDVEIHWKPTLQQQNPKTASGPTTCAYISLI